MKKSRRLIITLVVVVLLALTAVGVWAAPNRVGTVPVLSDSVSGSFSESISFGTGTVTVDATGSPEGIMTVTKISDPQTAIGVFPEGWVTLLDEALEVTITGGSMSSAKICVPYSPAMENKTPTFHYWDSVNKTWTAVATEVTTGTPSLVCGTGSAEGKYALLGK